METGRLQSLDALRGFDMLWIISGEQIAEGLSTATGWPAMKWLAGQLHHTPWNGFTFYDLIFPLFIFVAGVSMPYSFGKRFGKPGSGNRAEVKKIIYRSLAKRTVILILLGMIVNQAQRFTGFQDIRFASVLGRIGLACFFAALIFLNCRLRTQILWFLFILLGYWAVMSLVPVPGYGRGVLTPEGNLAGYIDRCLLPGKVLRGSYDPEGILSTIPAAATAMLGIFTGQLLRHHFRRITDLKKAGLLLLAGIVLLGLGLLWNGVFPINKNIWTSSFVLYTGGWSLLLLGLFYLLIDVWRLKSWSLPLVWIGSNSILIYLLAHGVVDFRHTSGFLFGGLFHMAADSWTPFLTGVGVLVIQLSLLGFLYRKKWFWKI